MKTIIELDDLYQQEQIKDLILPLKEKYDNLVVNAFAIPNKLGDVSTLKKLYPWIKFCIHGFEHTHFECAEWTSDRARLLIEKSLELGYESIFKAPNNYMDDETGQACNTLGVTIVHDHTYQPSAGYLAYPGQRALPRHIRLSAHLVKYFGSEDYIEEHPWFLNETKEEHEFVSISDFLKENKDDDI